MDTLAGWDYKPVPVSLRMGFSAGSWKMPSRHGGRDIPGPADPVGHPADNLSFVSSPATLARVSSIFWFAVCGPIKETNARATYIPARVIIRLAVKNPRFPPGRGQPEDDRPLTVFLLSLSAFPARREGASFSSDTG